ncbi:MAG: hypothetical protein SGBAC_010203, partial [Bacillariaceae sp.]
MLPRTIRRVLSTNPKQSSRAYSWKFSNPPLPPSDEDVSQNGLPLFQRVIHHGNRPFVIEWPSLHLPGPFTYNEVASKAATVSNYIVSREGVSSNASSPFVAHLTPPGSDYIACQWGSFGAAKASVPLSISQKVPELEHCLQDCDPAFVILSESAPNYTSAVLAAENLGIADRIVFVDEVLALSASTKPMELLEDRGARMDTPALLMYTSGTTGKPKGVLHTQSNLYHQITDLVAAWEWKPSDVALHVLPLHHVHGVVNVLSCAAYAGAQLQFQPFDANQLWHQWADTDDSNATSPNVFMAVPTIYAKLLEAASDLPSSIVQDAVDQTLQPMRLQVSGSAALPVSILEQWQNLTGHTLLERYGMTEFAMALSNPYQIDSNTLQQRHPGHVGLPLPSVDVRLVDQEDASIILDPLDGNPGALQVKGPTVFQEYWNRPEATVEAFSEDGYFDTGDVAEYNASMDSYRILGRASVDILKIGGHKLSALEVERVILEHEGVLEAVVVGVPDDVWGQKVGMI